MEKMFRDIAYLGSGNERQKRAYAVLAELDIFSKLAKYKPLLAGTIPIAIDTPQSDLDIVCEVCDKTPFVKLVSELYGERKGFVCYEDGDVAVCWFEVEGEKLEIYASPVPAAESNAFKHMIVEARLLKLGGEPFRKKVIELKKSGLKTEPAFAQLLELEGNPYDEMLILYEASEWELMEFLRKKAYL